MNTTSVEDWVIDLHHWKVCKSTTLVELHISSNDRSRSHGIDILHAIVNGYMWLSNVGELKIDACNL